MLKQTWRGWREIHPLGKVLFVLLMLQLIAVSCMMFLDNFMLGEFAVWLKPLKFALSVIVYTLTVTWLLSFVDDAAVRGRLFGLLLVALTATCGFIDLQAARHVESHFNSNSVFNFIVYTGMGIGAVAVAVVAPLAIRQILAAPPPDMSQAFKLALKRTALIYSAGAFVGIYMVYPTAPQRAGMVGFTVPPAFGSHTVGPENYGHSLPLVGWNALGGDLRPAHAWGLHALQLLLGLTWLLERAQRRGLLTPARVLVIVRACTSCYGALFLLLFLQALLGQPLYPLSPAFAIAAGTTVLATCATIALVRNKNARV